jgi:hypothetical protein
VPDVPRADTASPDAPVAARVRAGAALLDRRRPGWHDHIDVRLLDVGNCRWCLFGQLFGDYEVGKYAMDLSDDDAAAHGFELTEADEWADLLWPWVAEIEARRAGSAGGGRP